jgi:hypothetical protein
MMLSGGVLALVRVINDSYTGLGRPALDTVIQTLLQVKLKDEHGYARTKLCSTSSFVKTGSMSRSTSVPRARRDGAAEIHTITNDFALILQNGNDTGGTSRSLEEISLNLRTAVLQ